MTQHQDGAGPTADIHLVESSDGWLLTVTPDGFAALLAGRADGPADGPMTAQTEVTVEVRPNLVPGEPFVATVHIAELAPGRS